MTDIIVIGSVNLDLSASVSRLPEPGETVTGATLARYPGGKGANQALAARRLGADVTLIACIGDDAMAAEALALVRAAGVDLEHCIVHPDEPTGVALIAVAPSGENHIVVAPGANARLSLAGLELPRADAMICQLEVPADAIACATDRFAGFVCLNLAPARDIDERILARADLVVVNETESAWYGDRLSACGGIIATTFGKDGAELRKGEKVLATAKACDVNALDATGAGDAFTAALTVALVEGMPYPAALAFACAAGGAATTKRGAQPSLPTRPELEAIL